MSADATPGRGARGARRIAGVAGALLVALALVPEVRRSGSPGLGVMQIALLAAGMLMLLVAWLGARFPSAYRATAVMLLNTILLLAALEPLAVVVGSMTRRTQSSPSRQTYYGDKPWGARFVREQAASMGKDSYRPFALWKRGPTSGESVNVNAEGIRWTPGASCGRGAYRIVMLGGSTLWGFGSPDSGTIPAAVQAVVARSTTRPVCVVNLGEKGYTSQQELVLLITYLRSDEVPDLILFYDGVNDVRTAAEYGETGRHYGYRVIADKLEGVPPPLALRLRDSRLVSLVLSSVGAPADSLKVLGYRERGVGVDSLADQIVARYLDRNRMVRALAREYGFDYAFFWQPVLWRTRKPLTAAEKGKYDDALQGLPEIVNAVYTRIHEIALREDHLHDISDAFDGQPGFIYLDWNHVVPEGNALVARRMVAVLDEFAGQRWVRPIARKPPHSRPVAAPLPKRR